MIITLNFLPSHAPLVWFLSTPPTNSTPQPILNNQADRKTLEIKTRFVQLKPFQSQKIMNEDYNADVTMPHGRLELHTNNI
jgi:hypothetical protein